VHADGSADHLAVDAVDEALTYQPLDEHADRSARHLPNALADLPFTGLARSTSHRRSAPALSYYPTLPPGRMPNPRVSG
jgi:hypothetical protein